MVKRNFYHVVKTLCIVAVAFSSVSCIVIGSTTSSHSLQQEQSASIVRENIVEIPVQINGVPVTAVEDYAYANKQVVNATIPASVTTIGEYAFANNRLSSIDIPDSVISIGNNAFANNRLSNVTIGNNVESIGSFAFISNQLTNVIIPDSVTSIGIYAFQTNELASVSFGNNVTTIGDYAFEYNPLTNVTIGENVSLGILAIGSNFEDVYKNAGRAAGTYIRSNVNSNEWLKTP